MEKERREREKNLRRERESKREMKE